MIDTYDPKKFIPLGDAYQQAFSAIENWKPGAAANDSELHSQLDNRDAAERHVERLMRDAIADGHLPPFVKASNGQMEQIVDRESFRRGAFGVPGIENVPHHLTNPGPDIGGRPAFLKSIDFERWLKTHRLKKNKRGGVPMKFDWPDAKSFAAEFFIERGEFQEWDSEWKGQADLERQVLSYMEKTVGSGKGPGESTLRAYVSKWLKEWREGQ